MAPYAAACRQEILSSSLPPATSVFFGGGTPSLLPAPLLVSILSAIARADDAEVTVECNPETVSLELLTTYREAGVNRLSFGVQSMVPKVLAALGRRHDPTSVERAFGWARSLGFDSLSLDLIFGGAGETLDAWAFSLDAALALHPDHISAYALTVEPGTPLAQDRPRWPDDDDQADKYLLASDLLASAGFDWYEISNWARPGHECRHNQLYWAQGDYRGIGCAAHSHSRTDARRWWNVRTPDRYLALMHSGLSPVGGEEFLSGPEQEMEALQLALRTSFGVDPAALGVDVVPLGVDSACHDGAVSPSAGNVEPDPAFRASLTYSVSAAALDGLIYVTSGDRAVLTVRGRLLANEVARRLRPVRPPA